jgi:branched-chain amino acid transport system ATP-binding protein
MAGTSPPAEDKSTETILRTDGVTKEFGSLVAVDDLNWSVERRETKAVIGPNGAGKTTFFNLLCGVLEPSSGRVYFDGEDITGGPPHDVAQKRLVKTFQEMNVFEDLPVFENVRIAAQTQVTTYDMISDYRDLSAVNKRARSVLDRIGLSNQGEVPVGDLPYGDQRKVEIGIALATDPKVLLLDEPTAGMSQQETEEMMEFFDQLTQDQSLTIVLTEHDMDVALNLAETITVLHNGAILDEGTPNEVTVNEDVQRVYLGE